MPRDAFPGYDEPVNIDADPEEALRALLSEDPEEAEEQSEDEEQSEGSAE